MWVGPKMKEEKEIILYPNKGATVADLLEEAKKTVEMSPDGSGKLRYVLNLFSFFFYLVYTIIYLVYIIIYFYMWLIFSQNLNLIIIIII